MTEVLVRAAAAHEPEGDVAVAMAAARALERWGSVRGWQGPDPYDALNASRLPRIARRSPLALRVATQVVKRSPVNVRPLLGIPDGLSSVTLAHVISAYARNGFLDEEEALGKLRHCVTTLAAMRCAAFPEPCWGYHFDVQTRVFFYPRTTPNTIATAFAGLGLLDAYEFTGAEDALELAIGAGDFFLRRVPQTPTGQGAYFGYLPGDGTPIHNANMLVAALLGRLGRVTGRLEFTGAAREAVEYTVSRQRADGSWRYGEQPHLQWVDGFHTGYVLDGLLTSVESGVGGEPADQSWRRGLRYYVRHLIEPNGTPRYTPESRYPIDGQCVAQALRTLSLGARFEPWLAPARSSVLRFACDQMALASGAFLFQRDRWWINPIAHPRWVEAPLLAALTLIADAPTPPTAKSPPSRSSPAMHCPSRSAPVESAHGAPSEGTPPYRCPECGAPLTFARPAVAACSRCNWTSPPRADVLTLIGSDSPVAEKQYYDAEYSTGHGAGSVLIDPAALSHHWQSVYYPMNAHVWEAIGLLSDKDILLLGNGTSEKELYFLTRAPRRLIISDLSPNALRTIRKRLGATSDRTQVDFVALDAHHLPLADASVDLVYGYAFVHHLADIEHFLAETHRVLRPGGRCVFMDNRYSPAWQALKLGVLRPLMAYFHRREAISPEDLRATLTGWYREEELAEIILALGGNPYFHRSSLFHYLFTRASERLPPQKLFRWAASRRQLLRALIRLDEFLARFSGIRANQIRLVWGFTK